MQSQKYGRIINVGSGAGLYGNFGQANYSAAKMGILGLTNTLAIEGVSLKILLHFMCGVANVVILATGQVQHQGELCGARGGIPYDRDCAARRHAKLLDPGHITPIVPYLAHESNEHSGSCFEVGGGWYSQVKHHTYYHA